MVALTVKNQQPTFYFIGVTTGQSSAQRVFPRWMAALGHPEIQLKGIDCKIHDDPERYRQIVAEIKYDPLALGGLITTHKVDLLDAARELIDQLGPHAQLCDEVSCLAKRDGQLWGYAVDPIADGRALDALLYSALNENRSFWRGRNSGSHHNRSIDHSYFDKTKGDVLSLGAGGAAVALALHLIEKPLEGDRPSQFTFVDIDQSRLVRVKTLLSGLDTTIQFRYIYHTTAEENDRLLAQMPEGSVIINATGMGKDRPGSPLTDNAQFPNHSIVWELNYRGELNFMQQALAQKEARQLTVTDGWIAFLHGWTGVIAKVLDIEIDQETFDRLADVAVVVR